MDKVKFYASTLASTICANIKCQAYGSPDRTHMHTWTTIWAWHYQTQRLVSDNFQNNPWCLIYLHKHTNEWSFPNTLVARQHCNFVIVPQSLKANNLTTERASSIEKDKKDKALPYGHI